MSNTDWRAEYLDRYYRSQSGWTDGTTEFHRLLSKYVSSDSYVLELGAGPSNPTSQYLASITQQVVGLDIDPCVESNTSLTRAYVYQGQTFPFPDSTFDSVVSNYVNEHLPNPKQIVREVNRVLKDSGSFIFRTPNLLHYVAAAGWVLPYRITRWLANWLRVLGEDSPDPFPTYYRMNTLRSVRSILPTEGFQIAEFGCVEKEPSYGMRFRPLFLVLMLYERLVNSTGMFAVLRSNIFCAATKCVFESRHQKVNYH